MKKNIITLNIFLSENCILKMHLINLCMILFYYYQNIKKFENTFNLIINCHYYCLKKYYKNIIQIILKLLLL